MKTLMEQEAREAPLAVAKQLEKNTSILTALAQRVITEKPNFAITIGRGSSDHACTYAKYLLETQYGLVTASAAPSVVTVYNAALKMQNSLVLGISQSGKSPDICKMMEVARKNGAITAAILNQTNSPLAEIAEFVIPLWAGPEQAVAATKSYITSLTAVAQFVAILSNNIKLQSALRKLPSILEETILADGWEKAIDLFKNIEHTLIIARGFGFPIAQEAALKFKETAAIQAEAFSAAELMHGPFALIKKDHPFLLFAQNDANLDGVLELVKKIKNLGGKTVLVIPKGLRDLKELTQLATLLLPLPESLDPILDPIVTIQAFYPMIALLSLARGRNPDVPQNLKKVTETF
jgi:glutamine---fructose-6-phosphate transaminase (isomerizing)